MLLLLFPYFFAGAAPKPIIDTHDGESKKRIKEFRERQERLRKQLKRAVYGETDPEVKEEIKALEIVVARREIDPQTIDEITARVEAILARIAYEAEQDEEEAIMLLGA